MEIFFAVFVPFAAAIVIVALSMRIASHSFKCKNCTSEFHIKWPRVIITEHSDDEYMLVCPHCKTKGWCKMKK